MKSCRIRPSKWVNLWDRMVKELGRDTASFIFNRIAHPQYKERNMFAYTNQEGQAEPTFDSVIASPMVSEYLGEQRISDIYDKDNEHLEDTVENARKLLNQSKDFNKKGDQDLLQIVDYDQAGKITIKTVVNNKKNWETASTQQAMLALTDVMVTMLGKAGVTVTELTKRQRMVGRVGLTDFSKAYKNASEFTDLIKIANNMQGFNAISEEASHFIIGIYRNNAIVVKTINFLKNNNKVLKEVLGEEYDAVYNFYAKQYKNAEEHQDEILELVAEEATGQILRDEMVLKTRELAGDTTIQKRQPLFTRMFNFIKGLFKGINPKTYQDSLDLIKSNLSPIVEKAITGKLNITKADVKQSKREVQFNALTSRIEQQIEFLKKVNQNAWRGVQLMRKDKGERVAAQKQFAIAHAKSTVAQNAKFTEQKETVAGIVNYCTEAVNFLSQLYTAVHNLERYPVIEQAQILTNTLLQLQRFEEEIGDLHTVVTEEFFKDAEILSQEYVKQFGGSTEEMQRFAQIGPRLDNAQDLSNLSPEEAVKIIQGESQKLKLSDNEDSYIDEKGREFIRVTKAIQAAEGAALSDGKSLAAWLTPSTNIGTGIDSFVRDLIQGNVYRSATGINGKYAWLHTSGRKLDEIYPNTTYTQLHKLADKINTFIENQKAQGITLVARDITVSGVISTVDAMNKNHFARVAGTLDILGYNEKGEWFVYDIKTYRSNIDSEKLAKYQKQVSLYAEFLKQNYGLNVKKVGILPIKVSYPTPSEAGGTAKYTVKENNQLLIDGKEFKEAFPTFDQLKTIDIKTSMSFMYNRLFNDPSSGYGNARTALQHTVGDLHRAYGELRGIFVEKASKLHIDFLKKYYGDTVEIANPDGKGFIKVPIEQVVAGWENDVSAMQKWFTSMADNPDILLQMYDGVFKNVLNLKNQKSIEMSQRIVALGIKYEKLGITDYSFLYENDGKHYVNKEYDQEAFNKAHKAKLKELDLKYNREGLPVGSVEHILWKKEHDAWLKENLKDYKPDPAKYPSKYNSFTQAQKDFYDEWMEIKETCDLLLGTNKGKNITYNVIKIRRRGLERTKAIFSGDIVTAAKEGVKASFKKSFDDNNSYNEARGLRGFGNTEYKRLPALYTGYVTDKEASDLSHDAIGTLIAYSDACLEYDAMNGIVDELELARELLKSRKIKERRGSSPLIEKRRVGGTTEYSQIYKNTTDSSFYEVFNNFLDSHIYNRYLKDAGEVAGMDVQKIVSRVRGFGALVQLGFNVAAGISNLLNGIGMINIEAAANEYFNARELALADKTYASALLEYLGDIGQRTMSSKLALMDQLFNVRQMTKKELRDAQFLRGSGIAKVFGPRVQFICQTAGDHWLYNRVAIAMMMRYKLKDKYGKEISLWDAYETVYIDPKTPEAGKKLVLKEGVTKLDGSAFTKKDISDLINNIASVNQGLFGVYNEEDMILANQVAGLRLLMQYRDFLPRQFRKRFGIQTTNYMLGRDGKAAHVEGFYITTGKFIAGLVEELKNGEVNTKQLWSQLDTNEKSNIKRTLAELIQLFAVTLLVGIFGKGKKDDPWYIKWGKYLTVRQKTELGAMSVTSPIELTKILRSPLAASNWISDVASLFNLLNPLAYMEEVEAGDYKGHSKAFRTFMRSPITLWYKTFKRQSDIERAENYFYQD